MHDFKKFEIFNKVYTLKSFSRAAEHLYLSQPTISTHIASLEKELGVQLFERTNKATLPTIAAHQLFPHVQKIFSHLKIAQEEIAQLKNTITGNLSVGTSTLPAAHILPEVCTDFLQQYPAVTMQIFMNSSISIIEEVLNDSVDLGIIGMEIEDPNLNLIPLFTDSIIIVAPTSLKLPENPAIEELFDKPWIIREKGSATQATVVKTLNTMGYSLTNLNSLVEAQGSHIALNFTQAGLGLTFTSRLAAASGLKQKLLKEVPIQNFTPKRTFSIITRKNKIIFPTIKAFIKELHLFIP